MLSAFKISRSTGALITLLLATSFVFLFFHRHILEANQVSFASGGDGLKSTYGSLYHIEHDSSYWMFEGLNYPYGESVFFTGNQTFLTNIIKLCKDVGLDFSNYTLGILNLWMLFSYVLCALFLYLILVELNLPVWYALAGGILITFLSPQWERMSGHYNLAYAYVIPVALYLLIRFYRKPGYLISLLFAVFTLIIAGKHVYFIVLVGIPWGVFWLFLLMRARRVYGKTTFLIPHFLIQMLIPIILFILFSSLYDQALDRTAYPWGFFDYSTRWVSVFLPMQKPYPKWINVENLGYVGMVSTIVFTVTGVLVGVRFVSTSLSAALKLTDRFVVNALIAGAALCLFLALGYPFSFNPELLNHAGPFRQFRAIGRFVIPFFYIMNIYTFYLLWQWNARLGKRWFRYIVLMGLGIVGIEAYFMVKDKTGRFYNKYEILNDRENLIQDNHWVGMHDWSAYQAIMPMPYYHVGSENYWINGNSPVIGDSYIVSLKTGLPLNSVMLSRTSISQTLANLDLFWEPNGTYPVLKDYDSQKPLLIVRHRNGILCENEIRILQKSALIDSNSPLFFYRLYPDSLIKIQSEYALEMARRAEVCRSDTGFSWFYFESYDSLEDGRFAGDITKYSEIVGCSLPDSGRYQVSFWYEGAGKDLWPRTNLIISLFDSGMNSYYYRMTDFFRETVVRKGDRALISFSVEVRNPEDFLKIDCINGVISRGELCFDRVMVRKENRDILTEDGSLIMLNNRPLTQDQISP